jgi:hypothetical protein
VSVKHLRPELHTALAAWDRARAIAAAGNARRTSVAYHRAVRQLQWYVSLLRTSRQHIEGRDDEVSTACHALSLLGREAVPKVLATRAWRQTAVDARITLAAVHLADPAHGDPRRVQEVCDGPALHRLEPDGVGDLTPAERIGTAADIRMFVAGLIAEHPRAAVTGGGPWTVTGEAAHGFGAPQRDRRAFHRAVLPGCVGLDPAAEAVRLGHDSARMHGALARVRPGHTAVYARARQDLAVLATRLGMAAPAVD